VVGLTSLGLFAAVYLVAFVRLRARRRRTGGGLPPREAWTLVGLIVTFAAAMIFALGRPAFGCLVYVAVIALFALPTRSGAVIVALAALTPVVVPALGTGRPADFGASLQIVVAGLAVWGVVQLITRNAQLAAAREEIARLAVADERNRFARDLHDLLGHSLTVVAVKAELAGRLVQLSPERAEAEIADVERLAREALRDVRDAVAGYREPSLADELASVRSALLAAGIEADVPDHADEVPAARQALFGWAVREGVTNVVRHSGATRCRIRLSAHEVEITDNGQGNGQGPGAALVGASAVTRSPAVARQELVGHRLVGHGLVGHGLVGLRERAEASGGTVEVGRSPEGGFQLRVRVP
jgi:two-component system sensor histidine kinase DesK